MLSALQEAPLNLHLRIYVLIRLSRSMFQCYDRVKCGKVVQVLVSDFHVIELSNSADQFLVIILEVVAAFLRVVHDSRNHRPW